MPEIAFFDLDGTLTDPQVGITTCIVRALEGMGKVVPSQEELNDWIGPPLLDSFHDYLGSAALADDALQLYRHRFTRVGMFENEKYPDIDGALSSVARNCDALFVVTSKPRLFAERIIEHFEMASYFDGIYGSELDGSLTDKAELIKHVMREESIAAKYATMIGDRSHDIIGARSNAIRSVGVLWGYGSRQELQDAGADLICESVLELPKILFGE